MQKQLLENFMKDRMNEKAREEKGMIKVMKKDGTLEDFNFDKIIIAVGKSAARIGKDLSDDKIKQLNEEVLKFIHSEVISVDRIHQVVEMSLYRVDRQISESYSGYRNWKKQMSNMMETIVANVKDSMEKRDRNNSNLNSMLFSAKRTNVSKILLREMFMQYFLTEEERQAVKDGFIYVHDMDNRLIGTHNCMVLNAQNIMDDGFWINGYFCKEPKGITNAVGVMSDILITVASAQYGGASLREIDTTLSKYCQKTYDYWYNYLKNDLLVDSCEAEIEADRLTKKELRDALQGFEFQLNTRESSRGDFAFTSISIGRDTSYWGREIARAVLEVRRNGHGENVKQKMIFPKIIFIIRDDDANEDILDEAIMTSSVALYPDYIDDKVATPMGCRSFLSDYYLEDGTNLLWGRGNIGVVTLNLPLIFQNSIENNLNFHDEVIKYVDMIRDIHYRTYDYIGKQVAGSNPLMFCEGGFYGGHLKQDEQIAPIVKKYFTASFGTTALHELTVLATGKSLKEDSSFANDVIDLIQERINFWKEKDGYSYSIYGTPAENLCGIQVEQFRNKFGIIEGVSDRDYFSNSFHCHVSENITPFEKQDHEVELFHKHTGGHIQYVRIDNPDNKEAVKAIVKRGVKDLGLYQGTNLNACTCNNCGNQWSGKHNEDCPECGSSDITEFNRITGYLGFTRKHGDYTINDAKMSEVAERVSM